MPQKNSVELNEIIHFGAKLLRLPKSQLNEMEVLPRLDLTKQIPYVWDPVPGFRYRTLFLG